MAMPHRPLSPSASLNGLAAEPKGQRVGDLPPVATRCSADRARWRLPLAGREAQCWPPDVFSAHLVGCRLPRSGYLRTCAKKRNLLNPLRFKRLRRKVATVGGSFCLTVKPNGC